jgi:Helix-turn-helix domain
MTELQLARQSQRRLSILRHAEEVTGNVALTCRYYGISRQCLYTWKRRFDDEVPLVLDVPPSSHGNTDDVRLIVPNDKGLWSPWP